MVQTQYNGPLSFVSFKDSVLNYWEFFEDTDMFLPWQEFANNTPQKVIIISICMLTNQSKRKRK